MSGVKLRFAKALGVLPANPTPNTLYFVRALTGFDIYVTNADNPPVALKQNLDDESFERINQNLRSLPKKTIIAPNGDFVKQEIDTGFGNKITKTMSVNTNGDITEIVLDMNSDGSYLIKKLFAYSTDADGNSVTETSYMKVNV